MILWSHNDLLRRRIPVWIHCCKRRNYDFCISQRSAATYFRYGEMFTYHCVGN